MAHAVAVAAAAGTDAAVVARVEDTDEEPAVAAASPAPVEVEEVFAVEAVEHEGVAAARREAGEEHGIALLYFVVQHVEPVVDAVVIAFADVAAVVVSEVLDVGFGAEVGTRRRSVMHVDSLTAIVHQVGNSRILCIGYMIVFPDSFYMVIYASNSTKVVTSSFTGDFKTMAATDKGLTELLTVKDKDGNAVAQNLLNEDYTNGVLKNFKKVLDKSYESSKTVNVWGTSGIYLAIFFGLSVVMGFIMWILTRGKNNPNNYFTPWLTQKIEARLALSPAIITLIAGFFLTNQAPLFFILTLGLRVMWISMKELRPVQG